MDSDPNSAATLRNFAAMVSSASSQEMRCHGCVGWTFLSDTGPFGATRFIGYSTRSGEYTRSRYFATFAEEPACDRMCWIALDFGRAALFNRDQHSAGVGTVMRTGSMNYFFHNA